MQTGPHIDLGDSQPSTDTEKNHQAGEIHSPESSDFDALSTTETTAQSDTGIPKSALLGLTLPQWLYLFAFWVATLLTWVVSQNINQFETLEVVAFADGFPGNMDEWSKAGDWDNVILENNTVAVKRVSEKTSYAYRTFDLGPSDDRDLEKLQVKGQITTTKPKPENDVSDGGALMLWLQDNSDEVKTYLNIGKFDGNEDSYDVSRIINLTPDITRFSIVLTNKQTAAEFELTNASVQLLKEQPVFKDIRLAVFLCWAALLGMALFYLFKHASKTMFVAISLLILLTVVGVLMPESFGSGAIRSMYTKLQSMTGVTGDKLLGNSYKVGHFVFFFLTALMLMLYHKQLNLPAWSVIVLLVLFAIATEGLQLYLTDRTSRFSDLAIDGLAILIGVSFASMIQAIRLDKLATPA